MPKIKKNIIRLKQIINNWIVKILGVFLPKEAYIQHLPDRLFENNSSFYKIEYNNFKKNLFWSYGDANRIAMFTLFLEKVKNLEGDYAELGVHRGGTSRVIFNFKKDSEILYGFDTYEGFDKKDVDYASKIGVNTKTGHFSNTSIDLVNRNVTGVTKGDKSFVIRKGYFPDTFEGLENNKWKFVHLDADLYLPIKAGLELFYPRMVKGGIILVHDYGGDYVGAKKAVDEFAIKNNIIVIPMLDKVGSALIIKN